MLTAILKVEEDLGFEDTEDFDNKRMVLERLLKKILSKQFSLVGTINLEHQGGTFGTLKIFDNKTKKEIAMIKAHKTNKVRS